ncbi:Proline-rich protein 1 [Folsomia candida]|uniref:Proline-rich protein 1 n=1 Tax=Folsomia candida TaxID=158441 RepID=A0A226DVV1_FOLCA|nr:Proline-rich protein 1 [Folsomia candida]
MGQSETQRSVVNVTFFFSPQRNQSSPTHLPIHQPLGYQPSYSQPAYQVPSYDPQPVSLSKDNTLRDQLSPPAYLPSYSPPAYQEPSYDPQPVSLSKDNTLRDQLSPPAYLPSYSPTAYQLSYSQVIVLKTSKGIRISYL